MLSILSIKDKVIYGIDIIQYKLEYPQHSNFASLWSYLIALQIGSITFFFIKEATIFIFLFALSLCILTFLMYRILETFFNQDNLTDEISQKILTDLSKNENPSCLLSLYENTLNSIINCDVMIIRNNLKFYLHLLLLENRHNIYEFNKKALSNQFKLLSNKLSETQPSVFYSMKNLYLQSHYQLYTELSSNLISNSIKTNTLHELRNLMMKDLLKEEIVSIIPNIIDEISTYQNFPSNQCLMGKVEHIGEYDMIKSYMHKTRNEEYRDSIEKTNKLYIKLSSLYSYWIASAGLVNNYEAITDIYKQHIVLEKAIYKNLDDKSLDIVSETGFHIRAIDYNTLIFIHHILINGIKGHKIPDVIIPTIILFASLKIAYDKQTDENANLRLKSKDTLCSIYYDKIKDLLYENGYLITKDNCLTTLKYLYEHEA